MTTRQIRAYCELGPDAERLLERAMQQQGLTARAHDRILKVARTIADLEGAESLTVAHLAEAIQYRTLDRSYWALNKSRGRTIAPLFCRSGEELPTIPADWP